MRSDEVHVFLQALQHTQEHKVWLNIGGVKYKASQVTLRNDHAEALDLAALLTATDVEEEQEEDDEYLSLQLFSFFPFGDLLKSSHTFLREAAEVVSQTVREESVERVVLSSSLDEVDVFLQALQHTQEHKVWLNIGGVKYETSDLMK
jgi:hypothetical protein